ncbi:hypothetical protein [Elioraea rosea]|uniref:hypothetical protein n=1 Tax=Elioraea rosea TaxID=2492390 RepID=UPI0011841172|nr:hypothetical protein [Elioraea rosea]
MLALAAYFGLAAAVSTLIRSGTTDGFTYDLASALGTLIIPVLIALVVGRRRKSQTRLDVALIVSATVFIYSNMQDILSAVDVRRFQREIAAVPDEGIMDVARSSSSAFAQFFADAMVALDGYTRELDSLAASLDDQAFVEVFDPRYLGDAHWRAVTLPKFGKIRAIAATTMTRVDSSVSEGLARLQQIDSPRMTPSQRAIAIEGVASGVQRSRPFIAAFASSVEIYLTATIEMIDFLNTSEGLPMLSADGRLNFRSQMALDSFRALAERVDHTRAVFALSAEQLEAHRRRGFQRMRGEAG